MSVEREQIGDCTLYCGDCRDVLPTLGHVDAVVTDPPYGIAFDFTKERHNRKTRLRWSRSQSHVVPVRWQSSVYGDTEPFDPLPWLQFPQVILWGANHYASQLPNSAAWLIWDKRDGTTPDNHSDCELAWSNLPGPARIHRQLWRGVMRAGAENATHGPKLHPAQKPVALMSWCLKKTTGLVCDPYMGSGSTAVACIALQRPFIGCEITPEYFDIACQRITDAYKQLALFPPARPTPPDQQLPLLAKESPLDTNAGIV